MKKRTHDATQTGGISEHRREAYRRAQHAAKIQVFLEAMLGLSARTIREIRFGALRTAFTDVAAGSCTPEQAATFLRESARRK